MPYADRQKQLQYWADYHTARLAKGRKPCACGCGQVVPRTWARGHQHKGRLKHPVLNEMRCSVCLIVQPVGEFYPNAGTSGRGRKSQCRSCTIAGVKKYYVTTGRFATLAKKYGITQEWYEAQVEKQNGLCAICRDPSRSHTKRNLFVDHCHETGVVRGLLCSQCNTGVGYLGDNPWVLAAALNYVRLFDAKKMAAYPSKPRSA